VPTWRRNLGMVFQKYALFPHLTVGENVAYGMEERGMARAEIKARIAEALALVSLPHVEARYPRQLSGGEQQRVAMARAIVYRPDVLLLDEPLSNLDVKLRVAMRAELKRLQQTLGVTTIFVTHDQHEALALSDRLAVMRAGRIEQIGTPEDVYERPASPFVADFVGATNLLEGAIVAEDDVPGTVRVRLSDGSGVAIRHDRRLRIGARVQIAVKPERIRLAQGSDTAGALTGRIESAAYLGSVYSYMVRVGEQAIEVRSADAGFTAGDQVSVVLDTDSIRVFDA
jgi:ABC-type Fe3+/spermidine/putrescine transport system ATPase subunit